MRHFIFLSLILLSFSGCKKDNSNPGNQKLTSCPSETTCSYLYVDNANLNDYRVIPGRLRVFQASFKRSFSTTTFRFKADLSKTRFIIPDSEIRSGAVQHTFSCPSCIFDFVAIKPVGGTIKGSKIANNKWLIDAQIMMGGGEYESGFRDTVYFKQYFIQATNPEIIINESKNYEY